jgi:hypothetical protein
MYGIKQFKPGDRVVCLDSFWENSKPVYVKGSKGTVTENERGDCFLKLDDYPDFVDSFDGSLGRWIKIKDTQIEWE